MTTPTRIEREGPVLVLRLESGENRLGPELLDAFHAALDRVEAEPGPVAFVSTGVGRFYSTGLDLEGLAGAGPGEAARVLAELHRLFARLLALPVASVAALGGHAFAGGAMLALAHDFRVMRADRGFLCLPEVDLATGRPLTPGMYALLEARLPRGVLHEALVTGRRYGGEEALARDLVDEAAAADEVLARAVARARALAGKHRATLSALKRGLFARALEVLEAQPDTGRVPVSETAKTRAP